MFAVGPAVRTTLGRTVTGWTYSEHSWSPSYSRIELGLRTKYCAFWSGRTGGAMVEIYSLSLFVAIIEVETRLRSDWCR